MDARLGHRARLRQRVLGARSDDELSDRDVLELVLCGVIPRRDVRPTAAALLERLGSIRAVFAAGPQRLMQVPGVGPRVAAALAVLPIAWRRAQDESAGPVGPVVGPEGVVKHLRALLAFRADEAICVLGLDSRDFPMGRAMLAQGSPRQVIIHPRVVVEWALFHRAHCVVLAHNHPAGVPRPSDADISWTLRLAATLREVDIELRDHLVFTDDGNRFRSMARAGVLESPWRARAKSTNH